MAKSRKLWLLSSPSDMFGEGLGSASSFPKNQAYALKIYFPNVKKL